MTGVQTCALPICKNALPVGYDTGLGQIEAWINGNKPTPAVILYMVGIDQWICIGFGAASSSLLVWQTFALNARYGEHGLMKLGASRSHPRYLINRRRITRLFKRQRKEETT